MTAAASGWTGQLTVTLRPFFEVVNVAGLFVMFAAAAYYVLTTGLGIRELRRQGTSVGFQTTLGYDTPFVPRPGAPERSGPSYPLYFLIPCLNEAAVIGHTVSALRVPDGFDARIVVVDDGSDDDTAAIAEAAGGAQVHVVRRSLPDARAGKGAALNAGFAHIRSEVDRRQLDHDRVLVAVMDADGRLTDGAIAEIVPLFDDPDVGGVQLAVRIRNRRDSALLRFQDHQFWTLAALSQFGRIGSRTVSLGGNAQFTRLTALLDLGRQPWSESLTEDMDLAVRLSTRGWALTSTPRAAVDQQGVTTVRALIRQRTRWYQGHMMTGRRLPDVFRSRELNHGSALELVLYLLVPWLFDLPWSIIYHVVMFELALRVADNGLFVGGPAETALQVALWYVLAMWPAVVVTIIARLRDPSTGWPRAIVLGHCFFATAYLSYVCVWRALYRIIRRRNGWTKTARSADIPARISPGIHSAATPRSSALR